MKQATETDKTLSACQRTITIQQYTGTCWMNALLMVTFYSHGMHRVCRSYMRTWAKRASEAKDPQKTMRVFDIFTEIITKLQNYKNNAEKQRMYERFSLLRPEHILETMHQMDKNHFHFNPVIKEGYSVEQYMDALLSFLGVNVMYIEGINDLRISDPTRMIDCIAKIIYQGQKTELPSETITFEDEVFVLDACSLANNRDASASGHAICGITCGGKRYVYNGYFRNANKGRQSPFNIEAAPCELIPYDWDTNTEPFCLNITMCKLDKDVPPGAQCFNFYQGTRTFFYVNKKHLKTKLYAQPKENIIKRLPAEKLQLAAFGPNVSAECVQEKANWSVRHPRTAMFDTAAAGLSDEAFEKILYSSPKMHEMMIHINDLDDADSARDNVKYKHVIFTESKMSAKMVASALTLRFDMAYDKKHKILLPPPLAKRVYNRQALLTTGSVYGEPLSATSRKGIIAAFNERPGNVHGESVRIIIIDGGFKKSIDLLDVKYVHIFEPPMRHSDRQQIIGRATRFCGQQGLAFNAKEGGWPLKVFIYDVQIPEVVRDRKVAATTMHELVTEIRKGDGHDAMDPLASTIEKIVMESSVDYKNNLAAHGDGASTSSKRVHSSPDTAPIIWAPYDKLVNKCIETGGTASAAHTYTHTHTPTFTLNPSQLFMQSYFTPTSSVHGMLLWHSTGSGKTCTAITTASSNFESAGWTILWVTRSSLKKDMEKNMATCRSTFGKSKTWVPTMSYKQFTNFLQGKNDLYKRLVKRNGKEDPLRKTLLILDEAHLVINPNDLLPVELSKWLHNSYAKSGSAGESCKVMLMTATPVTDSPMNLIELVNMIKDDVDVLPTSPVEFTKTFLSPKGTFTPTGKHAFKKWIGPNVSYLNHMFDARQFAQPIVKTILAPMTQRSIRVETIADIALKKKNIKESYTRGRTLNGKKMRILDLLKKSLDLQIVHNRFVVKDRARLNKQIAAAKTDKMRDELRVQLESPEYKLVDEKVILENKKKRLDNTRETRVALANLKISEKVELDKLKFERRVMESDTSQERMLRVDCGL